MTYETFYQAVVLAYINHNGNPSAFFEEVVSALNQFRKEENYKSKNMPEKEFRKFYSEWYKENGANLLGNNGIYEFMLDAWMACDSKQSGKLDGLCEHGKRHCQCDNPRCPNYCD